MENKIKMLIYRSTHRGCKEMDVLMGGFAEEKLQELSPEELKEYEAVVAMDDMEIYRSISECTSESTGLMKRILDHHHNKIDQRL